MKHDTLRGAPRVDDDLVGKLAEEADTDPRSVVRRIAGLPVKGRVGARIDRVLAARGVATLGGPR